MFEPKKALTGVGPLPLLFVAFALYLSACACFRRTGADVDTGDLTFDGVCGPLPANRGALVVVEGLAFGGLFRLSRVMMATLWRRIGAERSPY